jgi:two-component system phosphate regulon sensor histidine kinase PhoR
MRKRSFRRLFIVYPALLVLAVLFVEFYVTRVVRDTYVGTLRESHADQARLIAEHIRFDSPAEAVRMAKVLKAETGARVTLISRDGRVLADSDMDASLMDNHLLRPEIQEAIMKGWGSATRLSASLGYEMLYSSARVAGEGGAVRFVRLAVPLTEVNSRVNLVRAEILSVVIVVLLVTGGGSLWQAGRLRRLVVQLTEFSRAVASGDLGKRIHVGEAGEFGEIASNLNSMSSELKGMLESLEEEKNRLEVILKSVPDALLITDAKGTIVLASSASRAFFGSPMPLTGRNCIEAVRNHDFAELMDGVRKNLEHESGEIRLDYPEEKFVFVRVSPLFYRQSELSGFVAVFHDTTKMKRLEEVRKDFVANVSHELKTPITAIKGFADTLLEGAIDDRENAVKFVSTIKTHSERINSLVDDLMMISKIELGVIQIDKAETDLAEVTEHVFDMLREKAGAKGLYLKTSIEPGAAKILADRDRLTQILTNLVDNAIKFTPRGGVEVGLGREDGRRFIHVGDTGVGVAEKHLPRLGERFYRVDPSRSRQLGGTGLGLAIVKHLVKAHGWEMKIESRLGEGTTVKIYISS